jgi:hypothetical protein
MTRIKLKLIPAAKVDPKKMTILDGSELPPGDALMRTEGKTDPEHVCGACGKTLLIGCEPGSIQGGGALRCSCGAYNEAAI